MTLTSVPPFNVQADSRLSDDTLLVSPLSIDPNAIRGTAVALADDEQTYLFAILAETGATEVQRSESSASGYEPVTLPSGAGATEIQAFVDSSQTLHAFWVTGAAVMHASRAIEGSWGSADTLTAANALGIGRVPMTDTWIAYGVATDGNLVLYLYSLATQSWTGYTLGISEGLLGCTSLCIEFVESTAFTVFAAVGGNLNMWSGTWTNEGGTIGAPAKPISVSGKGNAVTQVFFSYQHQNSAMVVFGDTETNLYTTFSSSTTFQQVLGAHVVSGSGFVTDQNSMIHFYGADKNGHLWVLHQKKWNDDGTPAWADIFPLDRDITYVAAPARRGKHVSLLAICMDTTLHLLTMRPSMQTPGRAPWVRLPIRSHSHHLHPMRTNRYRTSLTITDTNGTLCQDAPVTITPTSAVALEVNGKTVFATPDKPAEMTTDIAGVITFTQPALSLNSVSFHVTGENIPEKVAIVPHHYLHQQLSGSHDIFTGSVKVPPVSKSTLQTATVPDGNGGSEVLAPKAQSDSDLAKAAAKGINTATTRAASKSPESLLAGGGEPLFSESFSLKLNGPSPEFKLLSSKEDLAAGLASIQQPDSIWSDIADFFEDIWHAIAQGVMTVVHWVVDVVESAVHVVVNFAEQTFNTIKKLAIEGFEAVVGFVHGVFAWIGAEVEKVIDWLKDLFDWNSIWTTMETFYTYLQTGLNSVNTWLGEKPQNVDTFFADLTNDVNTGFANAINKLGGTPFSGGGQQSMSRFAAISGAPNAVPPPVTPPGSATQNNWFLSKLMSHFPGSNLLGQLSPQFPSDLESRIEEAWTNSGMIQDLQNTLSAVENVFSDFYQDPKSLWQTAIADILKVLQDIVDTILAGLDALTDTLIYAMQTAITMILDVLDTPLNDIPVISWLWDNILRPHDSQEPMTLGKLACLVMAVPVTLVCELVTGSAPFSATGDGMPASPEDLKNVQFYFSLFLAIVDGINDAANAFADSTIINPLILLWNWLDVVANGIELVLFWPTGTVGGTWDWQDLTKGQIYSYGTWIGYWIPVLTDAIFVGANTYLWKKGETMPELAYGDQVLDTIFGLVTCGTGTAGAIFSLQDTPPSDALDIVSAVLFPLPWAASFLCFSAVVDVSSGLSVPLKMLIDVAGDLDLSVFSSDGSQLQLQEG
jgi:hypothetical protein